MVSSCARIRCRRISGFIALSTFENSTVGLAIVAGPGGCTEETNEKGFLKVVWWTW